MTTQEPTASVTPGDVDSFVFSANAGCLRELSLLAYQGGSPNTCMVLYDPNSKPIFPNTNDPNNCTNGESANVVDSQTLSLTGNYTMILRMDGDSADGDYALSLERINPFPPNAQELKLATPVENSGGPFEPADNIYILRGYNRHLPRVGQLHGWL